MRCLGAHKERGAGLERTGISIINMYVGVADSEKYILHCTFSRLVYILLSAFSSQQYSIYSTSYKIQASNRTTVVA